MRLRQTKQRENNKVECEDKSRNDKIGTVIYADNRVTV